MAKNLNFCLTEKINKTVPLILKPKQKDKLNGLNAKVLDTTSITYHIISGQHNTFKL